jgi:surfeit locus 1 family protein
MPSSVPFTNDRLASAGGLLRKHRSVPETEISAAPGLPPMLQSGTAADYILVRPTGAASAAVSVPKRFPLTSWSRPRRSLVPPDTGRRRFAPGLWPTVLTLLGLAALIGLGTWQVERLQWKQALIAERQGQLAAPAAPLPATAAEWRAWDFRPVTVDGEFRHDLEQLFGVSAIEGRVGHHVLTPLVRPDGAAVLVDRGWVPSDRAHPAARREGQPTGQVRVTGIARYRSGEKPGWFTPDNQPEQGLWYWYDLATLQDRIGLELLPVVVEADATPNPGGLPIGGQTRSELPNNHLQYAITWYGLAAGLLGVWIGFGLARGRQR